MPPANACQWLRVSLPYRATTAASTCISFLLLSISLLSPSWMEIIVPDTNGPPNPMANKLCNNVACTQLSRSSGIMRVSRILLALATVTGFVAAISLLISCQCLRRCGGPSNMLVSSAASFTTGIFGFVTMASYTVDMTQKDLSSVGHLHFTWSFCLAWLVFTLYVMNGFFSLMTHLLTIQTGSEQHFNTILLEGRVQQPEAGDHTAMELSVLQSQGLAAPPARSPLPSPSLCLHSTII
ncbi:uncharacterized protein LOC128418475 [Podarcis raffonei]|uniref:uncharacterized protein LOC128418475 n=1 Tax=Podarcis raffonei TaxID=65483 RepID=UPI0023297256|nr:uncharacterized protein LOC128418475 [Podarcis raffonei]